MGEFDLIETYFSWDRLDSASSLEGVVTGIGDDAAVLQIDQNQQLVTSIDTLISGVHFPENTAADAIAHKALTVNLSDLAAMGAEAKWYTLALTLPDDDPTWLQAFSSSLKQLSEQASVDLVGGDTTRGPLSISIQVMGTVENNQALLRSGAQSGDKIFVTGSLGDAAAGLASIQDKLVLIGEDQTFLEGRLNYPTARLTESKIIKQFASSCIDLSDGLLQDLKHIVNKSNVCAVLDVAKLPLSASLQKLDNDVAHQFALTGGDDYELLFTVAADKSEAFIEKIPHLTTTPITLIGEIKACDNQNTIGSIIDAHGMNLNGTGYKHFYDE